MKYVRTEDGKIHDVTYWLEDKWGYYTYTSIDFCAPRNYVYKRDIIKEADNIKDLCDEFVDKSECRLTIKGYRFKETVSYLLSEDHEVVGAIWTDRGLIYVAQFNKKGDLELL